jgi:hypothetical protein
MVAQGLAYAARMIGLLHMIVIKEVGRLKTTPDELQI